MVYLQDKQLRWTVETVKLHKMSALEQSKSNDYKEVFDRIDTDPFYYIYVCEKRLWIYFTFQI